MVRGVRAVWCGGDFGDGDLIGDAALKTAGRGVWKMARGVGRTLRGRGAGG